MFVRSHFWWLKYFMGCNSSSTSSAIHLPFLFTSLKKRSQSFYKLRQEFKMDASHRNCFKYNKSSSWQEEKIFFRFPPTLFSNSYDVTADNSRIRA